MNPLLAILLIGVLVERLIEQLLVKFSRRGQVLGQILKLRETSTQIVLYVLFGAFHAGVHCRSGPLEGGRSARLEGGRGILVVLSHDKMGQKS